MLTSRPIRGATDQRHRRGAGAVAGCSGCQDAHPRPAAQAARSRPSARPGDLAAAARQAPIGARSGQAPERWVGFRAEGHALASHGSLKEIAHRGFRGASLKHRARDVGEKTNLRTTNPECLRAARREGPWVFRNPGVPRALGLVRWRNVNGKARARMRCESARPRLRFVVVGVSLCQAFCAAA